MRTRWTRLLVAASLLAALSAGCVATTPPLGDAVPAESSAAEDAKQPQDEPGPAVSDLECRRGPWTAC
jgi:hypothetical protein